MKTARSTDKAGVFDRRPFERAVAERCPKGHAGAGDLCFTTPQAICGARLTASLVRRKGKR